MSLAAPLAAALLLATSSQTPPPASTGPALDTPLDFDIGTHGAAAPSYEQSAVEAHGFEAASVPGDRLYSVRLPEGTYRVTLTIGSKDRAGTTTVKAEARRLMLNDIATRKGQMLTRSFLVTVRRADLPAQREDAPGGDKVLIDWRDKEERSWDDRLTLEFLGDALVSHVTIEKAQAPTVFIVGDSTVADQYAEPYASWGQMLPAMLDDTVAVANHAKSGATMKSFIFQLRLSKVLADIRPGDWLLIQFGHNDQKDQWPQSYVDPVHTYPAYLAVFVEEARARGARPVLVTSPERRNFDDAGHIKDTLGSYADAVRKVAAEKNVPLVDLYRSSVEEYEALGPDEAWRMFAKDGEDHTHHDNYGAWLIASAVAEGLRAAVPELAPHITIPRFDPARPPVEGQIHIAPSRSTDTEKPAGN